MLNFVPKSRTPWEPSPLAQATENLKMVPNLFGEGGFLGATFQEGPVADTRRAAERAAANPDPQLEALLRLRSTGRELTAPGDPVRLTDELRQKEFTPKELNTMFPVPSSVPPLFDSNMNIELAATIHRQWREQQTRESILNRYAEGHEMPNEFLWGAVGFMMDPLNAATAFIPPVGEAAIIRMLVGRGLGLRAATLGGKVAGGAAAGAGAQAVVSGMQMATAGEQVDQYTLRDATREVMMAASLNAAFHVTFSRQGGAISQLRGWVPSLPKGRLTPADVADLSENLPGGARAVADAADGLLPRDQDVAVRDAVSAIVGKPGDELTPDDLAGVARAMTETEEVGLSPEQQGDLREAAGLPRESTFAQPQFKDITPEDWKRDWVLADASGNKPKYAVGVPMDMNGFGDYVETTVQAALNRGARVFIELEGKRREIFSVSRLGMVDKDGNPWGVSFLTFAKPSDNARLRIEEPTAAPAEGIPLVITAADKQRLRDLSWTDREIREMTPAEAQQILRDAEQVEGAPGVVDDEGTMVLDEIEILTDDVVEIKTEAESLAANPSEAAPVADTLAAGVRPLEGEILPRETPARTQTDELIDGFNNIAARYGDERDLARLWVEDAEATAKLINDTADAQRAITEAVLQKYGVSDFNDLRPEQLTETERRFFTEQTTRWTEIQEVFRTIPLTKKGLQKEVIDLLEAWPENAENATFAQRMRFFAVLEEGGVRHKGTANFLREAVKDLAERRTVDANYVGEIAKLADEIMRGPAKPRDVTPPRQAQRALPRPTVPPIPEPANPRVEPVAGETVRVEVTPEEAAGPKETVNERFREVGQGRVVKIARGTLYVVRLADLQKPGKVAVELRRPQSRNVLFKPILDKMIPWLRELADEAEKAGDRHVGDKEGKGLRMNLHESEGETRVIVNLVSDGGKKRAPLRLTPDEARALANALEAEMRFDVDARTTDGSKIQDNLTPSVPKDAKEELIKAAVKRYGITKDPNEAGYVLPDGRMLDFSGRHEPEVWGPRDNLTSFDGLRVVEHSDVKNLLKTENDVEGSSQGVVSTFIANTGAIRVYDNHNFQVGANPTAQQLRAMVAIRRADADSLFPTFIERLDPENPEIWFMERFELRNFTVENLRKAFKPQAIDAVLSERVAAREKANAEDVAATSESIAAARSSAPAADTNPEALRETMRTAVAQTLDERPVDVGPIVEPSTTKTIAENELNLQREGSSPGLGRDAFAEAKDELYGPDAKPEARVESPSKAAEGEYERLKKAATGEAGDETQGQVMAEESFKPVKSSNVGRYAYNADTREMQVEFKDGSIYSYAEVTPSVAAGLATAESAGRYLHQAVKGKFAFKKIKAKPAADPEVDMLRAAVADSGLTPEEMAEIVALDAELKAAETAVMGFAQAAVCTLKAGI